jgi:electron transport complex protein RnfB
MAEPANPNATQQDGSSRRNFLRATVRGAALAGFGVWGGFMITRARAGETAWQIDPAKCTQCGLCATECVLEDSAVKAVHSHSMCGYCELCTGYFEPEPNDLNTAAENQLCPTDAIRRHFIEDPYHEYTIEEELCIGCAKCVAGCTNFGNGSLYLQIKQDRCLMCNDCSIAIACPSEAFSRLESAKPYTLKGAEADVYEKAHSGDHPTDPHGASH